MCNPHTCQWVATDKRGAAVTLCMRRRRLIVEPHTRADQEVVTSIIAIMGGIAMACKAAAEVMKKVRGLFVCSIVAPLLRDV